MTIPNDHVNGSCVNECRCRECVRVRVWIGEVAEREEELHHLDELDLVTEIKDRLEPNVRIASNKGAEAVQVIRNDGRVALRAPLDDEEAAKKIIRMRAFDVRCSMAQRKEHTTRRGFVDDVLESSEEPDDLSVSEQRTLLERAVREALEELDPADRVILWLRVVEGKTRREVEEFLGISSKTVRCGEERAANRVRLCLSGIEATPMSDSRGLWAAPFLGEWTPASKRLVAPLINS